MLFFVYFFFFFEEESRVSDSFRGETQLNRVLQLSSRTEGEKKLKKPRRAPVRKSREGLLAFASINSLATRSPDFSRLNLSENKIHPRQISSFKLLERQFF